MVLNIIKNNGHHAVWIIDDFFSNAYVHNKNLCAKNYAGETQTLSFRWPSLSTWSILFINYDDIYNNINNSRK